jgi:hypothetical protein
VGDDGSGGLARELPPQRAQVSAQHIAGSKAAPQVRGADVQLLPCTQPVIGQLDPQRLEDAVDVLRYVFDTGRAREGPPRAAGLDRIDRDREAEAAKEDE